ncbi:MAG: RNase adapter RapZ [Gammaproteobacteria bacterium]|nr:RNase adapter RapZ [Gammaproteobacteria bacterium]
MTAGRRFIVITGLSGAGKSVALNALEDLEFYCIDNLPAGMLEPFCERTTRGVDGLPDQVAVGIDARNPEAALIGLPAQVAKLRAAGVPTEVVFLDAGDDALVRRFSETRRRHPLSSAGRNLPDAIGAERRLLGPLSEIADLRIDTSHSTVHELRKLVQERVARRAVAVPSIQFMSFGYKFGIPLDADFVFDVRCLPNPYWEPGLRNLVGTDAAVAEFLRRQPDVEAMLEDQLRFLERWIPRFESEQRSYLSVALGCTGGRHRSVYMADWLARRLGSANRRVLLRHRDLE